MAKAKRYHTLLTREPDHAEWTQQFGDYDKGVVEFELNYYRDHIGVSWAKGTKFKIISTASDQEAIAARIAELNRGELV